MIRPRHVLRGARGHHVPRALAIFLEGLTSWNVYLMQVAASRGRTFPELYGGRFAYQREDYSGPNPEDWRDAAEVVRLGGGDCEDLAAYRAAELRMLGLPARARYRVARQLGGGRRLFHITVDRGDGGEEDPSRVLGMSSSD